MAPYRIIIPKWSFSVCYGVCRIIQLNEVTLNDILGKLELVKDIIKKLYSYLHNQNNMKARPWVNEPIERYLEDSYSPSVSFPPSWVGVLRTDYDISPTRPEKINMVPYLMA